MDLYIVTMLEVIAAICDCERLETEYYKVVKLVDNVRNLKGIKEWIQTRPNLIVGPKSKK